MNLNNISPDWKGSTPKEQQIIHNILKHEAKPTAIKYFSENCSGLGNYWYWFILSTLWVSYTGWSDLELWKKLLSSDRPNRPTSIMKPDEFKSLLVMNDDIEAFRAHRKGETDWISYTLSIEKAVMFASQRGVRQIHRYLINKKDVIAYFSRRGEFELIVLDKEKVIPADVIEIVVRKN